MLQHIIQYLFIVHKQFVIFLFHNYFCFQIKSIVHSNEKLSWFFASPALQLPLQIVLRIYTFLFMGWCLLPFGLLQFGRYMVAFKNVNYVGAILFLLYPFIYSPVLKYFFKKKTDTKTD